MSLAKHGKTELFLKYDIDAEIADNYIDSPHIIFPLEELSETSWRLSQSWDLLVIDETHRLLMDNKKSFIS